MAREMSHPLCYNVRVLALPIIRIIDLDHGRPIVVESIAPQYKSFSIPQLKCLRAGDDMQGVEKDAQR